jgi:hypothetical protein
MQEAGSRENLNLRPVLNKNARHYLKNKQIKKELGCS